jgi:hypothetical protein
MLDRFTDALTGRRLGGALLVLSGLVVAGIVLWPGGGEDSARAPAKIVPVRLVSVPQLGLAFAYPSTWSRTVAGRVIRLRNADRDATLTFSTPVAGRYAQRVKDALKQALRKRLAPATIVHEGPGKLGRRRAMTFELQGFGADDTVRALVLVASSPYRTYAVTLLTPSRPSAKGLAQVQQILATVRLTKPQRSLRRP